MVMLSSDPLSQSGSVVSHSTGFRLRDFQDDRLERESTTSSVYKQRIDSMFGESRSLVSGFSSAGSAATPRDHDAVNNTVQARIEKMFAEVSKTEDTRNVGGCRFPVRCLGSVPLRDKVTSLQGLQEPLRELYLMKRPREPGSIEISKDGLRLKEGLKPFQTIAVWASVQFILRKSADVVEYAFLPLIADPDALDKGSLFKELRSMKGTILESKTSLDHHPLFAVVMRKPGPAKVLECHGFVCSCSEDAIVIAANLYQALMTNMQRRHKSTPKNKNGVSYLSTEGSSHCGSNVGKLSSSLISDTNRIEVVMEKTVGPIKIKVAPKVPVRPPRQKKKSVSSSSDGEDIMLESKYHQHLRQVNSSNPSLVDVRDKTGGFKSRRTVSESMVTPDIIDRGDILTKIAIPRSQSFLNPGGPLTRYQRTNDGPNQGSPLGFHELFTEFRIQEGLHSLDDILDVIIDANGMSFNDLKPIYKEFLMKLAVTLTRDELYQRSKNIMRRQRKKGERGEKRKSNIKRALKRSVKKLKSAPQKSNPNFEFTSVLFPATGTMKKKKLGYVTTSSSSFGSRRRASRRQSIRRRSIRKVIPSISEDSDFFSMARTNNKKSRDRSSSGYISCSECSFDSEHCTCNNRCYCSKTKTKAAVVCHCDTDSCVESDKCYCKKTPNVFEQLKERGFAASESSASSSPTPKHEIAYSKSKRQHASVKSTKSLEFLQMKPKWESGRESSIYQKQRMDVYESLPVIQSGGPPSAGVKQRRSHSSDNLLLDYDLFSRCRQRKVLVVSARDTRGRVIYNKTGSDAHKSSTPCDALSVKKSAEIAALFHEVKLNQEQHEVFYNTLEPPPEYFTMKSRTNQSDLEVSLGYLP